MTIFGQLTASQAILAGYSETLCIECTNNGFQKLTFDNIVVQQERSPCWDSLSIDDSHPHAYKFDFGSVGYLGSAKSFFTNSEELLCPITACALK